MAESKALTWDKTGERLFETGIEQVALYPFVANPTDPTKVYPKGVAWNGITALNITPSGAEPTPLYANNKKYLNLMSNEEIGGTIEAFTYPDEWAACDGSAALVEGVYLGQQARSVFGLVGKTLIGNDTVGTTHGYKLHIIYGALASPSEKANATVNDSPEAQTMSWEFSTTPVDVDGFKPTSYICIDSTKADKTKLAALEKILYGDTEDPRLPLPAEIKTLMAPAQG
jgi:hypothetical protein